MEYVLDPQNWLNFRIYSKIEDIFANEKNLITHNRWYYDKVKNLIGKTLVTFAKDIKFTFFTQYKEKKPENEVIESNFDLETYLKELKPYEDKLEGDKLKEFKEKFPLTRFIKWRLLIDKPNFKKVKAIKKQIINTISDFEDIFGYEIVAFDVGGDIGNRYCKTSERWNQNAIKEVEINRLLNFLKYWDGISRYTISMITDDLKLDSEHTDTMGILHLGFNTLGTAIPLGKPPEENIPQEKCPNANCDGELVFNSSDVALNIICNECNWKLVELRTKQVPPGTQTIAIEVEPRRWL